MDGERLKPPHSVIGPMKRRQYLLESTIVGATLLAGCSENQVPGQTETTKNYQSQTLTSTETQSTETQRSTETETPTEDETISNQEKVDAIISDAEGLIRKAFNEYRFQGGSSDVSIADVKADSDFHVGSIRRLLFEAQQKLQSAKQTADRDIENKVSQGSTTIEYLKELAESQYHLGQSYDSSQAFYQWLWIENTTRMEQAGAEIESFAKKARNNLESAVQLTNNIEGGELLIDIPYDEKHGIMRKEISSAESLATFISPYVQGYAYFIDGTNHFYPSEFEEAESKFADANSGFSKAIERIDSENENQQNVDSFQNILSNVTCITGALKTGSSHLEEASFRAKREQPESFDREFEDAKGALKECQLALGLPTPSRYFEESKPDVQTSDNSGES